LDALARWRRLFAYQPAAGERTTRPGRLLVLIPSRAEGARVADLALDFRRESRAEGTSADVCVILDGSDAAAEERLRREAVDFFVKEPAGPSKAFVLAFAAERLGKRLDSADFVMVFDADMRLPEGFLAGLAFSPGTEAFQLPVRPAGTPPPGAARVEAFSLAVATRVEDLVRDGAGLPVRLRGKAMGFSPRAFRLGPLAATRTMAEDSEATLLLLAAGMRVRALSAPVAFDEPSEERAMAAPRARWLAGHVKLMFTGAGDLGKILLKSPRAAGVLAADLFLRPRALVLLMLALVAIGADGALLRFASTGRTSELAPLLLSSLIAKLGLIFEMLYYIAARRVLGYPREIPPVSFSDLLSFVLVWFRALGRAILAPGTWHRARPFS
jgi:cellulose synthase/poly-beta-1,6-N-acetylglucosamine synthase-like glycosyltransferase